MIGMNYIKELNAFREWLLVHELPTSAIVLWYTLMGRNHIARWKRTFNAPNGVTQQLSGLSKSGVHVARKSLVEHGLITYEPGEKGKAPIYEMLSLVQKTHASVDPSVNPSVNEPCTIHKHKQNKERKEEGGDSKLVKTYEQNIGEFSPITKAEYNKWVDVFGEDVMWEGIKLTCKYNGRTFRYLEKILKEWKMAKIATVEAVTAYEEKKAASKANTIPFIKAPAKQSIFDELREEVGG